MGIKVWLRPVSALVVASFVCSFALGEDVAEVAMVETTKNQEQKPVSDEKNRGFYELREGETLKESLLRWVDKAGYEKLVWNVKDQKGRRLVIPIHANARFEGDLVDCLRSLKTSYALSSNPIHLDIQVRKGNRIIFVELLNYDG